MKRYCIFLLTLLLLNLCTSIKIRVRSAPLDASSLLANIAKNNGAIMLGNLSSSGSSAMNLVNDGTANSQGVNTNTNNSAFSLLGGIMGTLKNEGVSAAVLNGSGSEKVNTTGNNSLAVSNNGAALITNAGAASVTNILSGSAKVGTSTDNQAGYAIGNNHKFSESNKDTALGSMTGNGIMLTASDVKSTTLDTGNSFATSGTNTNSGQISVDNGSGNMAITNSVDKNAVMGNSSVSSSSLGSNSGSIVGSGTVTGYSTNTSSSSIDGFAGFAPTPVPSPSPAPKPSPMALTDPYHNY